MRPEGRVHTVISRGTILHAPGDAQLTIVTCGETKTRLLIEATDPDGGTLTCDWTLPASLVERTIACMGYVPVGVEDPDVLLERVALAAAQLRVQRMYVRSLA